MLSAGTKLQRKSSMYSKATIVDGPFEEPEAAGGSYYQVAFPGDVENGVPPMSVAVKAIGPGCEWEVMP